MSIYPPILLGRIIAPKMPPSDKKGYLYKKILYFRFGNRALSPTGSALARTDEISSGLARMGNRVASGASAKVGFYI